MAELQQTQLWDDTRTYQLLATSGRPSATRYNVGSGIPVRGIETNQNGLYVADGDQWFRFQILQTEGADFYPFRPGTIIQVATTPNNAHPLHNTGYLAVVVRNSHFQGETADTYSIDGLTDQTTRQLNDVTCLPLQGSSTEWASLCQGNTRASNGTIRRARKSVQEYYGTLIKYGFDPILPLVTSNVNASNTVLTGEYSQGDGDSDRFNRDHNFLIENGGHIQLQNLDIIFGYPETTDNEEPLINRNNWATVDSAQPERPRFQATSRNHITAASNANPDTLWNFTSNGGVQDFIGTDFFNNITGVSDTFISDQGMSFGNVPQEIFKNDGSGTTSLSVASDATGLGGFWVQNVSAGSSSDLPDFQDVIASPRFFNFDLSGVGTNASNIEVQDRAVDMFYYGSVAANGGQPLVLNIPIGTFLPVALRGTGASRTIFVDFRQVPGYVEPDLSNSAPVFFFDSAHSRIAQCSFDFARPGDANQNFSSVLRFDDTPHVTDTNVIFDNTNPRSRVEIDGRVVAFTSGSGVAPYFDYVTISDSLADPNAANSDLAIVDAQTHFELTAYGLDCRAVAIEPFAPDSGPPILGSDNQLLELIDPATCITKAYDANESHDGQVAVRRTLRGTISNGKDTTMDTGITLYQAGSNVTRWNISASNGQIDAGANPGASDRIFTKEDAAITLTDGDSTYPPNTHPYRMELPQYIMPHNDSTQLVEINVENRFRVAITEPGCVPEIIEELDVGARMRSQADVRTQFNAESTNARPRYDTSGITAAFDDSGTTQIGIGNVALEQDRQFPLGFDFTAFQQPSDTNPLNNMFDMYTGLHLLGAFRVDDNGANAGDQLQNVNYVSGSTENYMVFPPNAGGAITVRPEGQQTDTWTEGDGRVSYGKVSWDPMTRTIRLNSGRPGGNPSGVNTPFAATPADGEIDIQGIAFQGTAGQINARQQPIRCGFNNAVINEPATANAGRYEMVHFMMPPGDYNFNNAEFLGDLSNITFENTEGTSGGAVNISFTGTGGSAPNTGQFSVVGTVNFPDSRTFVFPQAGQVVLARPATTTTGHEVVPVGSDTTNHVTTGSGTEWTLQLTDGLVPIGTELAIYYKPYDTTLVVPPPINIDERARFHLVRIPYTWDAAGQNQRINVANLVDFDIVRQFSPEEELDMGTTTADQYTPPTGRFDWSFYDRSDTPTDSIEGAQLRINLHGPGATGSLTNLNVGQTKQFLYWWMERQDLMRSGANHYLEAIAAADLPVDHTVTTNTSLPQRFFAASIFVDTTVITLEKFAETDPQNILTGLTPVPYEASRTGGPGGQARYAIKRSEAANAAGNAPSNQNDSSGSHVNSRDLYLIDETRVIGGSVRLGIPDLDNQQPQSGISEFQVQNAAAAAIDASQANNILHWHADGQSSKIPVGRTYDPAEDYTSG